MEVSGCVHVHVENSKIVNVFSHLSNFPEDCIIHLKADEILTPEQFLESHPQDKNELYVEPQKKIFDLGDDTI